MTPGSIHVSSESTSKVKELRETEVSERERERVWESKRGVSFFLTKIIVF